MNIYIYEIFEVSTFPVLNSSTSLAIQFMINSDDGPFYLHSSNSFVTLNTLSSCQRTMDYFSCFADKPIYPLNHQSCSNLLFNGSPLVSSVCPIKVIINTQSSSFFPVKHGYRYLVSKKTAVITKWQMWRSTGHI